MRDKVKKNPNSSSIPEQALCFAFFPVLPETFVWKQPLSRWSSIHTSCELGKGITPSEIIPATPLMFTQLGLQTLWLAYLQSLELFSITQLYIYVYIFFNQPFLPGRAQH